MTKECPNPKDQCPSPNEAARCPPTLVIGHSTLVILWSLGFGNWALSWGFWHVFSVGVAVGHPEDVGGNHRGTESDPGAVQHALSRPAPGSGLCGNLVSPGESGAP